MLFRYAPEGSETEFTLRLLPLGGYVAFPEHTKVDEETGEEVVDSDPDLLQNRPIRDRAIVISAGVVANIILAWAAIFSSISAIGVPVYSYSPGVVVAQLVDNSGPAAIAGMRSNDIIMSIDGRDVAPPASSSPTSSLDLGRNTAGQLAAEIRASRGRLLNFGVQRDGARITVPVRPNCCLPDGSSSIGVQLVPNGSVTRVRPPSPLSSVRLTNAEFSRLVRQTCAGLVTLVSNFRATSQNLSGPLGVVSMGADLARNDAAALLTFSALISINLAVINSLPLPALDGGQMTFLAIEALRGSPVSMKVQDAVNRTALLVLLTFSSLLLFGDIGRLNIAGALQKLLG